MCSEYNRGASLNPGKDLFQLIGISFIAALAATDLYCEDYHSIRICSAYSVSSFLNLFTQKEDGSKILLAKG